ncbi:glutathione S-transferase P 1-like [Hyperolius riggenbachi]|uniref:glutathione S-transferase P 1-like n=1 Tax=Hyperolius riggenbachi TaxID=752182 RepID=UPI0035A31111
MSELVLTYFPLRGRGEPIRLLLADNGASWKENVVQFSDWSEKSPVKEKAVFGQMPKFSDGELDLYQSNTILRYLGRKFGVAGSNDREIALVDMVNDGVEDLRQKFFRFVFFELKTEKGKENYEKDLPKHLKCFERILSNNSNGTKFTVGDKISYADYNLLDILHCHQHFFPDCLSSFPLLTAYKERIESRSKLSEYLNSEQRSSRPMFPNRG